ncbi:MULTISPECIES: DNA-binding protein [Bacillus cereus group]|nr:MULTISPECIES: DNA-binding protein [Bacillus cereus group]KAB2396802.1 DNA-binding protein [Bacillus cereus]MRB75040.1 DNA-binding protein [Bacillus thuringiensis]PGW37847.1 DNA-binding protein [Bacillus thuringiensis]
MGKISASETRYAFTIEKNLKAKLEQEAKEQNRSLNNLIETILKEYISNK